MKRYFIIVALMAFLPTASSMEGSVKMTVHLTGTIVSLGALRDSNSTLLGGAQGLLATEVVPGSQAAMAGFMVNDVLVRYGSTPVLSSAQLIGTIKEMSNSKQAIAINVIRDGQLLTLSVRPGTLGIRLLDVDEAFIQQAKTIMSYPDPQQLLVPLNTTEPEILVNLDSLGVTYVKRPEEGKMKGLAFIKDPDGYWIEILSAKGLRDLILN